MKEKIKPFEKLITELKMNEKILIEKENLLEVINDSEYIDLNEYKEWISEDGNIEITEKHLEYMYVSGLEIDWTNEKVIEHIAGNNFVYGSFLLNDIYTSTSIPSHFWKVYNDSLDDENQKIELLNNFQSSGHGNDGTFGCFYRKPKEYPFPIYFYDNGVYFPMSLNLDEYYEAMLFCKAVVLWQYFYIDPKEIVTTLKNEKCSNWISLYDDLPNNPSRVEGLIKHMNILIEQFPVLFPDFDISFFEEKRDSLVKEYSES